MQVQVKAPVTTAWTHEFNVPDGKTWKFTGEGMTGSDAVTLQEKTKESTFQNYVPSSGVTPTLTTSNTSLQIVGPFLGRWSKGTTSGAVALYELGSGRLV